MNVEQLVSSFLDNIDNYASEKTISDYRSQLKPLVQQFGDKPLKRLTADDFIAFVNPKGVALKTGKPFSRSTVRARITISRRILTYALRQGYIKKPIIIDIRKPRDRVRDILATRTEQAAILRVGDRHFRRIYQALRISGARPGELCNAQIEDYRERDSLIVLEQYKGFAGTAGPRKIGVGKRMRRIMDRAIGDRISGPIFLNRFGRPWTTDGLSQYFRRIRIKLGLPEDLVLYSCTRHDFGTRMVAKHGLYAAAHAMGHRFIDTTMRYAHAKDSSLAEYQDSL